MSLLGRASCRLAGWVRGQPSPWHDYRRKPGRHHRFPLRCRRCGQEAIGTFQGIRVER